MMKNRILYSALLLMVFCMSGTSAMALSLDISGTVNSGGFCTDQILPDYINIYEDWSGKKFDVNYVRNCH